jgi:ABC-type glucose/galactose transport system permease subunit
MHLAFLLMEQFMPFLEENSSKRSPQPTTEFWAKADRLAVIIVGGAALGSAIGQIPGALVGGILATVYGWYISADK